MRRAIAFVCGCCAVLSLRVVVSVAQTPETMAISGVTVIDTINSRAIPNSTVTIRDGIIASAPDGDAEQDHLAYASPGLLEFLALNRKMSNVSAQGVRDLVAAADTAAGVVADMQRAGVGILAGCDGMVAGFCLHDELMLMVKGGMSAAAALQTATINPARSLGLEKTLGSVEAGKRADMVLLDANPLDNIANVGRIDAVVIGGKLLDRPQLDATLATARKQFQSSAVSQRPQ